MRIGIFTESYPPLINGVSTSVQTLIGEFERCGHTVFVFTSRFPGHRDEKSGIYRFPSVNAVVEPDYYLPIPFSPRIRRAIPGLNLDIVHSHTPFFLGLLASKVARQQKVPLVSTNHTLYTEYAHYNPFLPGAVTRKLVVRWMRWYYDGCDHVIAPSRLTRERLLNAYGVSRPVSVIPTGIPEPPFVLAKPADTRRDLGLEPEARLLVYVGRLAAEKNLDMLLEAFRRIVQVRGDTYLVMAGSGHDAHRLKEVTARLGVDSRVLFTGFLNRTRLDPLYQAADLFLFPSKTETQGLAVGEALAAGLPAIVVNGGGAPEAIDQGANGYIIEDDAGVMAEKALWLLSDETERLRLSRNAKHGAAEMAPDRIAAKVLGLYESLIHDGRMGRRPAGFLKARSGVRLSGGVSNKMQGFEAPLDT